MGLAYDKLTRTPPGITVRDHRHNTLVTPRTNIGLPRYLIRFNNIAIQGTPQMAAEKEAIGLSRVYSYYYTCDLPLF